MDNGRVIQLFSDNGGVNADSDPCNTFDPLILLRAEKVTFCKLLPWKSKMQNWAVLGTYDLNDSRNFLTHYINVTRTDNKVFDL